MCGQVKKVDKDASIDKQVLLVHQEIAKKLRQQPSLIQRVEEKLEQRYADGLIYYGAYISWSSILELQTDMDSLTQQLCEQSKEMNKLRRNSPFVGLLNKSELENLHST